MTADKLLPQAECREGCKRGISRKEQKKNWGVITTFTILIVIVVMVSLLYIYHISFIYQIYIPKLIQMCSLNKCCLLCQLYIMKSLKNFI